MSLPSFNIQTFDELLEEYARERTDPSWSPVRLGWGSIDADLRGVGAGQVLGVAARATVGKTWALASIAQNFTTRRDSGLLIISLEQPGIEWTERQFAIYTGVAPETVETWAREKEIGLHVGDFTERFAHARVVEDSVSLQDLPGLLNATSAKLSVPLRLVLIDYLGLIGMTGANAYETASGLGKGLKIVAKREKVAIVVAMQLSRAGGDGSEPVSMAMLRDSGVLEESLDFLLGCWRPGKAMSLSPSEAMALQDVMRVAVLKNRKGRDGRIVDLLFDSESRRLTEPSDPFMAELEP